jgi:hypothetical protein
MKPASRHQGVELLPRKGQNFGCELPEGGKLVVTDVAAVALGEAVGEQRLVAGPEQQHDAVAAGPPGAGASDALLQHAAAQVGVDLPLPKALGEVDIHSYFGHALSADMEEGTSQRWEKLAQSRRRSIPTKLTTHGRNNGWTRIRACWIAE